MEQEGMKSQNGSISFEHLKTRFLANMSHELRTPLNGIVGSVRLLQMSELDEEQVELVEAISQSSRRMMHLVENVLLLSSIEAGQLETSVERFMPLGLLKSVAHRFEQHGQTAYSEKVPILLEADKNLPQWVIGEKDHLTQIMSQLLDNARRHTTQGQIQLRASLLEEDKEDAFASLTAVSMLQIEVRDTGIGIEPEVLPHLFEAFSLTDDSYTRKFQGAGLGLYICRKLADHMKASLSVKSVAGEGSAFTVKIPVRVERADMSSGRRAPCVMVVEDDETSRILMGMFCKVLGIDCVAAENGERALEYLETRAFDLLLMDIQMPGMSGLEVIQVIREHEKETLIHTKAIAVTAYAMSGDREMFLQSGFDDYLEKPVDLERFRKSMVQWGLLHQ